MITRSARQIVAAAEAAKAEREAAEAQDAPLYIERDTHTGRATVKFNPAKYRVAVYTAAELAELAPVSAIFDSFGSIGGVEHFGRTRYVADAAGNLHCYDSDGAKKIIHPAERKLRILTAR